MILAVAVGGAVGALLRWLLDGGWAQGWPWPTLVINVLGCLLLGVLTVLASRFAMPGWVKPGLGTGVLGGFTTFSAYAVQVHLLGGATGPGSAVGATGTVGVVGAVAYLLLTPVLCVGAAGVAMRGTERVLHTGLVPDDPDWTLG